MILPLRTDSPIRSTPWVNAALITINVIAFLVQQAVGDQWKPYALQARDPHLIQYFTYQFLHDDGLHIASNMLFLYIFGNNVNDRIGNIGYLAFYLAGGVFAGITFMLFSGGSVIGASGAVSAVTGAFLVLLPRAHIRVFYWWFIIGVADVPSFYFIIYYFIQDFIYGFAGFSSRTAHTAHLGGSVFGFAVSFALLSTSLLPRDPMDLYAIFKQWNRRRQYQDMVRQGYDPFGLTPKSKKAAPDPNLDRIHDIRAQISEALAQNRLDDAARFYLELRAIDPRQVLARQSQLDIANQLFSTGVHSAAAEAYESFIQANPKYEQLEQVQLMLGLLYARYLNRPDVAKKNLVAALERLSDSRQVDMAKGELDHLGGAVKEM